MEISYAVYPAEVKNKNTGETVREFLEGVAIDETGRELMRVSFAIGTSEQQIHDVLSAHFTPAPVPIIEETQEEVPE